MGFWKSLVGLGGNPITEIGNTIDKLTTSGAEKSTARQKALEVMVDAQAKVIVAEAQAGGITATWRPIAALSFVAMIWWWALSAPLGWTPPDLTQVPKEVWQFLFGYGIAREVNKTLNVVSPLTRKQRKDQEK